VIVAFVTVLTAPVVTVKVAELVLAATVTLDGSEAAEALSDRVTTAPPEGAFPLRVTVAVEFCDPPTTVVGLRVSEVTAVAAGFTVRVAV